MLITLLSCLELNFSLLDFICCVYRIKYYKTAFQARLINVYMRMGQRKCTSPLQGQRSFWISKCYE